MTGSFIHASDNFQTGKEFQHIFVLLICFYCTSIKISIALALSAGAWGIYWLPQRILEDGGLTGGWGTIAQMVIGTLVLLPVCLWRKIKGRSSGFELPLTGFLVGGGFVCYALSFLLTDVVRALILFYMTPVWTTIFEIL